MPGVTDITLTSDGQTVTVNATTNRSVDTLQVDVDGPVDAELTRGDFTVDQRDDAYVYTADVEAVVPGTFENVVENSVQHADVDAPAVRIETARSDEFATVPVRIADNGQGTPEDVEQSIFTRGVSIDEDDGQEQAIGADDHAE